MRSHRAIEPNQATTAGLRRRFPANNWSCCSIDDTGNAPKSDLEDPQEGAGQAGIFLVAIHLIDLKMTSDDEPERTRGINEEISAEIWGPVCRME